MSLMEELYDDLILLILAALRPRDCASLLFVNKRFSRLAFRSLSTFDLDDGLDAQFFGTMLSALLQSIKECFDEKSRFPNNEEAMGIVESKVPLVGLVDNYLVRRARLEGLPSSIFGALIEHFPNIESVSLREVNWVSEIGGTEISPLANKLKLRELRMIDCPFPSPSSITNLWSPTNMKSLAITYVEISDDVTLNRMNELSEFLPLMPLLEDLEFPVYIPSAVLNRLPFLRRLKYFFGASFAEDFDQLRPMQSLTDLSVSAMNTDDLYPLLPFPNLRRLTLTEFMEAPQIEAGHPLLNALAALEKITIENCNGISVPILVKLPAKSLVSFQHLRGSSGQHRLVHELPRFENLKHLYLNVLEQGTFTEVTLTLLPKLRALETLSLLRQVPEPSFDAFYLLLLKVMARNGGFSCLMANFACLEDDDLIDLLSALGTSAKLLTHLCILSGLNALTTKSLRYFSRLPSLRRLTLSFLIASNFFEEDLDGNHDNLMVVPSAITLADLSTLLRSLSLLNHCLLYLRDRLARTRSHRGEESAVAFLSKECPSINTILVDYKHPLDDSSDYRFDFEVM